MQTYNQHRSATPIGVLRAIDMSATVPQWLWPNWLVNGRLNVLMGTPAAEAIDLAVHCAATVTNANIEPSFWPDGTIVPAGAALFITAADRVADVLMPRLDAAGAVLEHVLFAATDGIGQNSRLGDQTFARLVCETIRSVASTRQLRLVIFESFDDLFDKEKLNAAERIALDQIIGIAASFGIAILGLANAAPSTRDPTATASKRPYFKKSRVFAWITEFDLDERGSKNCVLRRLKSDFAFGDEAWEYRLVKKTQRTLEGELSVPVLEWDSKSGSPDFCDFTRASRRAHGEIPKRELDVAADFLKDELADQPLRRRDVFDRAKAAGIAQITLRRAREKLGVVTKKICFPDGSLSSVWSLPTRLDHVSETHAFDPQAATMQGMSAEACTRFMPTHGPQPDQFWPDRTFSYTPQYAGASPVLTISRITDLNAPENQHNPVDLKMDSAGDSHLPVDQAAQRDQHDHRDRVIEWGSRPSDRNSSGDSATDEDPLSWLGTPTYCDFEADTLKAYRALPRGADESEPDFRIRAVAEAVKFCVIESELDQQLVKTLTDLVMQRAPFSAG